MQLHSPMHQPMQLHNQTISPNIKITIIKSLIIRMMINMRKSILIHQAQVILLIIRIAIAIVIAIVKKAMGNMVNIYIQKKNIIRNLMIRQYLTMHQLIKLIIRKWMINLCLTMPQFIKLPFIKPLLIKPIPIKLPITQHLPKPIEQLDYL